MFKKSLPILILLLAFFIRAYGLVATPPGLTHDEAGHGHDAAYILKGIMPIYFTVGYGREPLFDYLNSGFIFLLGANVFTLRFAALVWGTLTLALTYRVARTAFNSRIALIALALISTSFWQLNTSRQILRSDLLPVEISVAVILFLKLTTKTLKPEDTKKTILLILGFALSLAASFYTYIPARILWLIFPLTLITNYALQRRQPHAIRQTLFALALAFLLASPLFIYLYQNPNAEQRIGMLNEPLTKLQSGDASQLLTNARELFFAFFLDGHGDHFLAYTMPGKPVFDLFTALLFAAGLIIILKQMVNSVWQSHQPIAVRYPLFTFWLLLGIAPSLITGPEALTTRLIGAQPVLYIIPALAINQLLVISKSHVIRKTLYALVSLFIISLFISSIRDYFFVWGNLPQVRAAYQVNTIEMAKTLRSPAVISSVYPTAAHDPYIAELITPHPMRWIDGRTAFLIPNPPTYKLLLPSSTPLHPAFKNYVQALNTTTLRATDLDPAFTTYQFTNYQFPITNYQSLIFNNALQLLSTSWSAPTYAPNDVAELLTVWRVLDENNLGTLHPPAYKTDLTLFTHILNNDEVYLQRDALDAPSWSWHNGDTILQIHQIQIPAETKKGEYQTRVGVYDRVTGERMVLDNSGEEAVTITPLVIR